MGDVNSDGWNLMATLSFSDHRELRGDDRDFVNTFQPDRGVSVDTRGTPFATILPMGGSGIGPNTPLGTIMNSSGPNLAPFIPGTTIRASGGINPLNLPGGGGCDQIDGMQAYDTRLWNFAAAQYACAWDTGRAAVLQQPIETVNFVSRGVLRLGEHELAAELTGSKADSAKRFSNLQITPNTSTQNYAFPRNAASAQVYDRVFNELVAVFPTLESRRGLPMTYRWRCMECGRREIETTTETGRVFFGADGPFALAEGWQYRAGASYAFSESESQLGTGYYYRNTTRDASGNIIANGIIDALNTGVINPFLRPGETQSQAALDLLAGASAEGVILYGGKFSVTQIDGSVSGPLFSMPAGEVLAAIGIDYRKEEYRFNGDPREATARPVIIAAPFDNGNALDGVSRDVKAIYGEVMIPVIEGMELTAAVRRDEYDGFGSTVNPKISLKYRPLDAVMFRASYGEGFRVPSFNQIFNASAEALYTGRDIADPERCPGGRPNANIAACAVIQPNIISGGKPDLGPEEAEQASFGVVYQHFDDFSVSLDWWRVDRIGTIQILTLQQLADNYETFRDRYVRDASGTIVSIDRRWVNAGESTTEGLELAVRVRGEAWGGNWTAGLDGTKMLEKKSRIAPSLPFSKSEIGFFTFSGDLGLEWKHNAFFSFNRGDWSASISQIFRSGYTNQELPGVTAGIVTPPNLDTEVDDYVTYNASVTWRGYEGLTVTAGIKNMFNEDPPFAITYDSNTGAGSSWEPRVADPRNRSFTLLMEYRF
jgi:iron complex outermembrane receptor protein